MHSLERMHPPFRCNSPNSTVPVISDFCLSNNLQVLRRTANSFQKKGEAPHSSSCYWDYCCHSHQRDRHCCCYSSCRSATGSEPRPARQANEDALADRTAENMMLLFEGVCNPSVRLRRPFTPLFPGSRKARHPSPARATGIIVANRTSETGIAAVSQGAEAPRGANPG